jgi:hypothetical protein
MKRKLTKADMSPLCASVIFSCTALEERNDH